MKGLQRTLATALAALVMLSAVSFALADGSQTNQTQNGTSNPVDVQSDSGKLVVQNSAITIWFQGYKPVLHIFQKNSSGVTTGFTVAIRGVYELNSTNKPVAVLPMTMAFPEMEDNSSGVFNATRAVVVQYDNASGLVNITFTLTSTEFKVMPYFASQTGATPSDMFEWSNLVAGQATVQVVFHINAATAHVKFDFHVNQWTWVNQTGDKLALNAVIIGHQSLRDSTDQAPTTQGTEIGDSNDSSVSTATASTQSTAAPASNDDNVSVVGQNFLKLGYVSWGKEANATYSNGTTTPVNVSFVMFSHGMTEEDLNYTSMLFVFNTPAGWNTNYSSLAYDPTIGITLSSSGLSPQVVALGAAIGVVAAIAVIGAVVALRRRI